MSVHSSRCTWRLREPGNLDFIGSRVHQRCRVKTHLALRAAPTSSFRSVSPKAEHFGKQIFKLISIRSKYLQVHSCVCISVCRNLIVTSWEELGTYIPFFAIILPYLWARHHADGSHMSGQWGHSSWHCWQEVGRAQLWSALKTHRRKAGSPWK